MIENREETERKLAQYGSKDSEERSWSLSWLIQVQTTLFSTMGLLCGIVYFMHFNFALTMIKQIYIVVLLLYPVVAFCANMCVANNLRSNILQDADNDPENAEFLDFEDDEEDILRKAKVRTVS